MTYRPDIDGLRAIAVLAVVLFHLDISPFSGGYIGVDVFFVISGFLITSIIESKCRQNSFRFGDFYLRRVRRLMPALVVTIFVTYLGAAALFSPDDLIAVGRSAVAAQFSLSNILFFSEAGYWDSTSEFKPLLHTWSLGVEEQFYLFWPALVVFLAAQSRRQRLGLSMLLLALGGTVLCVWYTGKNQSGAFYLLPFRVNQFALGALVIYIVRTPAYQSLQQREWVRLALGFLGLALVLYSAIFFDNDTVFPGWAVLAPTLGAMFLLLSGSGSGQAPPLQMLLANRASIWLGKVSYSMYLVHWPIITLYRYDQGIHLSPLEQLGLGLATLLLTVAMHRLVETRFYSRQHSTRENEKRIDARFLRRFGLVMVVCTVAPLTAWFGDGWSWRYPSLSLTPEQIRAGKPARRSILNKACRIDFRPDHKACNSKAATQVLLLGNSTEPDGFNFFHALLNGDDSVNLVFFAMINYCTNLRQENGMFLADRPSCQLRLDALFTIEAARRFNTVIYVANRPFSENKEMLYQMLRKLKVLNPQIQLITMGGYINTKRRCSYYVNKFHSTAACAREEHVAYFGNHPATQPKYQSIMSLSDYHIDLVELLCKHGTLASCRTQTEAGVPAWYDHIHMSLEFAQMAGRLYGKQNPEFRTEVLGRPGTQGVVEH